MSKRNDGNEQDLRIRPDLSARKLIITPATAEPCAGPVGEQTDLNPPNSTTDTPATELDFDWADLSELCPGGYSLPLLNQLIMKLLKLHFSSGQLLNPELGGLTFRDDPVKSDLRIALATAWTGQAEKLPALMVKRGQVESKRLGIGDFAPEVNEFARMNTVAFQVLVFGITDGQTEALAQEVFDYLTCVSPILLERLPLIDFQVVGMSGLEPASETPDKFAVAISLTLTFEHGWAVTRPGVDVRRILLNLRYSLRNP